MMMRQIIPYLLAALVCATFAPASYASGVADCKEMTKLISQNCDARMTPNDLAFFLATHNYDATPKDGYVQVKIDGTIYKVVPSDEHSGLANISIIN
jgi:hypothetical protein